MTAPLLQRHLSPEANVPLLPNPNSANNWKGRRRCSGSGDMQCLTTLQKRRSSSPQFLSESLAAFCVPAVLTAAIPALIPAAAGRGHTTVSVRSEACASSTRYVKGTHGLRVVISSHTIDDAAESLCKACSHKADDGFTSETEATATGGGVRQAGWERVNASGETDCSRLLLLVPVLVPCPYLPHTRTRGPVDI